MKNFTKYALVFITLFMVSQVDAQKRYLEPVFDDVSVSGIEFYGSNFTVLPWVFAASQGVQGNTLRQPLAMQIYEPEGDTDSDRPLVLYLHTGNFFPFPLNGSCGGTLQDSANVEIATRLASMGYVVAVVDYRLGWLPTHPQELVRRYSLINGAYRGAQDVNSAIRFFKASVGAGNPYGIDSEKVVVWGQGTGGYLSLATAYLNEYSEILTTSDPNKFLLPLPDGSTVPMIIEAYNGDIEGVGDIGAGPGHIGIVDATYNALSQIPVGDTLFSPNLPELPEVTGEFALAVNMGGALGDSTWLNEGEVPIISVHTSFDPFAPYETDVLLVPTAQGPQPVVEVSGSYDVQKRATRLGVNDIFNTIPEGNDPIGDAINPEFPGLFEINSTPNDNSAPWEWTDLSNPALLADDCNGDGASARTYIDSIIMFYAPRACVALGLNCDFAVSTNEVVLDKGLVKISPNPVAESFILSTEDMEIKDVQIFSVTGQLMQTLTNVNQNRVQVNRNGLQSGIYIVKTRVEEGIITQQVMFE